MFFLQSVTPILVFVEYVSAMVFSSLSEFNSYPAILQFLEEQKFVAEFFAWFLEVIYLSEPFVVAVGDLLEQPLDVELVVIV